MFFFDTKVPNRIKFHVTRNVTTSLEMKPMNKENSIKLFEEKTIRTHWDAEKEEWYFSVIDVVAVLSDSVNPTDYLKKMRKRDELLGTYLGTICPQVAMRGEGGKLRKVLAANTEQLLRIIQSIPSPKAEPFKLWLARVGSERIDETANPELAIDRALETYLQKGYSRNWINQRLKTIEVRKELTNEWEKRGVSEGRDFAMLTDEITRAWSGKTTGEYKAYKGLKKESLRDNMTNVELVLNMLAEVTTTDISRQDEPETMDEHKHIARRGGSVAKAARVQYEKQTGKKAVTPLNARSQKILADKNGNEK
jgi:prophage antirepressor-like protein